MGVRVLPGEVPPWAAPLPAIEECGGQQRQQRAAAQKVADADAEGRRLDVVLYGDSLTAELARTSSAAWDTAFAGLDTLALGACSSSVANLAWRILEGGERPSQAPKVVAFLIGINNVWKGLEPPAPHLDWLVGWARAAWPGTQVGDKQQVMAAWPGQPWPPTRTFPSCPFACRSPDPSLPVPTCRHALNT